MEYYAGIDVSLKDSSICVVDATGQLVREVQRAGPGCLDSARRKLSGFLPGC